MVSISPKVGTISGTVGGTITPELLAGQFINRDHTIAPSGNFADTFDTAANIAAAFGANVNGFGGASFFCTYVNNTNHSATLTAPVDATNFTLNIVIGAGGNIIPASEICTLLIQIAPGGAVTVNVLYYNPQG